MNETWSIRQQYIIDMGDAFRVNFYRSNIKTGIENPEIFAVTGTENIETSTELTNTGIESRMICIENIETDTEDELLSVLSDTEKK